MSALRAFGYGLARAWGGLWRRPLSTTLTVGAVAVALLLVAAVHLAAINVDSLTHAWSGGAHMIVYLEPATPPERIDAIASALRELPAVARLAYVSQAEAHAQLREVLGDHSALLDEVEIGVLPASLEVAFADGVADVAAVSPIVDRLRGAPGVESVEFLDDWASRLAGLLSALRLAASALAALVALAGVYVIMATVRLGLEERRDEMAVLDLVGASGRFIRGPLLVEGALLGALGAVVAALGLWLLYDRGAASLASALSAAFGPVALVFLAPHELAMLVGGGAAVGVIGAWLATGWGRARA